MNTSAAMQVAQWREAAHACLQRGDVREAQALFQQVLDRRPDDVEALQLLASCHVANGELNLALARLQAAALIHPEDPNVLQQLGAVHLATADGASAAATLRETLRIAPDMFVARLHLGQALEQLGEPHEALKTYFGALRSAQNQGRWLNDETTAPGLRDTVKHAMRFVDAGRLAFFHGVLEPLQQRYGADELERVTHCLDVYLGERSIEMPDARQRPKFLYFPGIPSQPYYPRERFPWQETLEAATGDIREELQRVLAQEFSLETFLGAPQPGQAQQEMLRSSGSAPAAWDAYFFFRHGERYEAHLQACPRTAALLDSVPLARIRNHAPESLFSVLSAGTHILPHTGVTNVRLVTHLPLIVPPQCALRVGGATHIWREGRCVTFDDTFEHEAWNRSEQTRVVLILDCWNPDLTEAERAAVAELIEAIGDFSASGAD
ncbi:aspartyl/asparaginyl beta-hydroxylase domain-containing protein [Dyella sp. 2HG41-7]|uniref:aspartyl/asparaginyl beta-hydroxylase domain-containing protein n=1 Tax=Dyella sp. 2HG41-7 TaxID=2883239 RepID=UPI001F3E4AEB|nr:aspartyl/asparaginyl beta-hydroxylase domain-containing protein [Dyella sp. 2HG41-7]